MDCEILTVGTELVLGFTVDTNAAVLGQMLADAGIRVRRHTTVSDDPADIRQAVKVALDRTGTVIVTGGLGPTKDDLTRHAVAEVFGKRLLRDPGLVAQLEARFRNRGIAEMPVSNLAQADVPEGAVVLPNALGTAPGLWIEDGHGRRAVLLPGVPREMRGLMESEVMPRLIEALTRGRADAPTREPTVIRSRTLRTTGIGESALHDTVGEMATALPDGLTLAWLPTTHGTDLRVTAWDLPEAVADGRLAQAVATLRQRVGACAYGEGTDDLAAIVLDLLRGRGARLAVAESCTGGRIGARLTSVPGSSRVFAGGVIAYDNDVKLGLLGVSADTLAAHGAVSEAVAREMAAGAARALGTPAAVAVTGIAGPDGGTDAKPVGTMWIAVHWQDAQRAFHHVLPGDREDVRRRAAQLALDALRRVVTGL